nr:hypothetical protein [Tanacetum cinerariifolium]
MSLSLAKNVIVVGADNRSPMLDKTNYSSWASRMPLYSKGKPNGKLLVDSVLNGPFQYGTIIEPETESTAATVRARPYTDLTYEEKLRESVDITTKNIVLQGLPQDIYNLVNHNEGTKEQFKMEESLFRQFKGDRHRDMLTMRKGTLLQIQVLTDKGLEFKIGWLSVTTVKRKTADLDTFNFDCDDVSLAKAILMANLYFYDSDVLLEESKQKEDKYLDEVIDLQKENKALDNMVYKMGQSMQTMHMLTKPQTFYDETHKTAIGYQNPFYLSQAQQKVPALYDSNTIFKTHVALFVTNSEETLKLAEESRLKMLAKQNDLSLKEKKVNIAPINYVPLNKLSKHFVKQFVPQKQLSAKQVFWLPISQHVVVKPPVSFEPVLKKEIPRELPSISLVKDSFHKMKEHVNEFDETITYHTKITGNRIGSWGLNI